MKTEEDLKIIAQMIIELEEEESNIVITEMRRILLEEYEMTKMTKQNSHKKPGVYAVFENKSEEILYVGETGNLSKRYKDLFNTKNHSFRRKLGNDTFQKCNLKPNEVKSNRESFHNQLEKKLTDIIEKLDIKGRPLYIGRKEVEEKIIEIEKEKVKRGLKNRFYNIRAKRK